MIGEEELLSNLLRWAMGSPFPPRHRILEKNLYGEKADPWRVLADVDDSHWYVSQGKQVNSVLHVITKLIKVKTRVARRAGCGTWSGQTSGKRIYNKSGQLIGSKKMFVFQKERDAVGDKDHHWIMNEYTLAGIYLDKYQLKRDDFAVCRIKRMPKCGEKYIRREKKKRKEVVCSSSTGVHQEEEFENSSDVRGGDDQKNYGVVDLSGEEVVCSSSDGVHQEGFEKSSDDDRKNNGIADLSVTSPDSDGFGVLTVEDFEILNNVFVWTNC